jgi:O-antigen/teichoic acid export membrane protein
LTSRLGLSVLAGALSLVTTPLLLGSLGVEGYGAYALIIGIPALLPFLDLGLGAVVTAAVAKGVADGDLSEARARLSATAALLAVLGLVLLVAALVCGFIVDWQAVLGLSSVPAGAVSLSVTVVLVGMCIALPLSLGARALVGLKQTHVATLLGGVLAAFLGLAGIAFCAWVDAPLWGFAAVQATTVFAGAAACAGWVRVRYGDLLRLRRPAGGLAATGRVFALGAPFVAMAVATAVAYETDLLVVSHRVGEQALADYSVALKYFNLVYPALVAAGFALWPILIDAVSRSTRDARRGLLQWTIVFGLAGLGAAAVLVAAAPWLIDVWTRGQISPPGDLIAARAVFFVLSAVHYPASMAVLALGYHRLQAVTLSLMAAANLPLSIVLADALGVAGPVWASCVCFGALHAAPLVAIAFRRTGSHPQTRSTR